VLVLVLKLESEGVAEGVVEDCMVLVADVDVITT
jgi:hypothetical protein